MRVRRLQRKADFDLVFQRGTKLGGPFFLLLACRNSGHSHRSGIVAGRKIGRAVKRNRARRLLREALWRQLKLGRLQPHDIVLVARAEIHDVSYRELENEIQRRLESLSRRTGGSVGGGLSVPDQDL